MDDDDRVFPTLRSHLRNNSNPTTEAAMLVEVPAEPTFADGSKVAAVVTKNYGKQVDSSDRDGGPPNLLYDDDIAAFAENQRGEVLEKDTHDSLKTAGGEPGQGYPDGRVTASVRRLTPTECERLMGWPDHWTVLDDTDEANPQPDGRRYAACGDGVVAPVAEWIGRRLITHL